MNDNIDPESGPQPWSGLPDQLKPVLGETLESFEGFVCYFNLGHERSLRLVAKKLGFNLSTVKEWSAKFGWRDSILKKTLYLYSPSSVPSFTSCSKFLPHQTFCHFSIDD